MSGKEKIPLAHAHNDLGLRLFTGLVQDLPTGNVLISPTSIGLALALLYNGAAGETERQMAATLALEGHALDEVNAAAARLMAELQLVFRSASSHKVCDGRNTLAVARNATSKHDEDLRATALVPEGVQLALANSLWVRHTAVLHSHFLERAHAAYQAEVRNVDFGRAAAAAALINEWTADRTKQKIRNLVSEQALDAATLLVLVNALYFKGAWTVPFDESRTRPAPFHSANGKSRETPTMSRSGEFEYLETSAFQAVNLPYSNGRFHMLLALPRPGVAPGQLPALLRARGWPHRLRFKKSDGYLALPRFKIEYGTELSSHLARFGMGVAFSSQADFSALTEEPVWIKLVQHKTFLEVNEQGSEAAAATAVTIVAAAMFSRRFEMRVDRPFFCTIQDSSTGTLLFVGQICQL
jgi:serine protease inhibitor